MNNYIRTLKGSDAEHSILHILAQIRQPEDYPLAPILAPTSLKIQSLSNLSAEGQTVPENDATNMLVYVQMTGSKPMPEAFLQPTVSQYFLSFAHCC